MIGLMEFVNVVGGTVMETGMDKIKVSVNNRTGSCVMATLGFSAYCTFGLYRHIC